MPVETLSSKLANLPDGVSVERGRLEVRWSRWSKTPGVDAAAAVEATVGRDSGGRGPSPRSSWQVLGTGASRRSGTGAAATGRAVGPDVLATAGSGSRTRRGRPRRRPREASAWSASVSRTFVCDTSIGYARVSKTGRAMCSPSGSSTAFAGQGTQVDTTTAVGRERELIRERAVAGLKDRVGSRTEGRRPEVRADERLIQSAMVHRERPVGQPLRELRPTVRRFFAPLLFVDLAVLAAIGLAAPIGDDSVGGPC